MFRGLICSLLLIPGIAAAPHLTANEILTMSKAASGGGEWDAIRTMRITGTEEIRGIHGTSKTLLDFRTGDLVSRAQIVQMTTTTGVHGSVAWYAMSGRPAEQVKRPGRRKAQVSAAYVATYGWWDPNRPPAQVNLLRDQTENGVTYWVVHIKPKGGSSFDLWINATTKLVARVVNDATSSVYFSDYRNVHGIKFPFHKRAVSIYGGKKHVVTHEVEKVVVNVPVNVTDFVIPSHQ